VEFLSNFQNIKPTCTNVKEQVMTPQERRLAGIRIGMILLLFKHLHLWLANHRLQKVCIRRRTSNHACR